MFYQRVRLQRNSISDLSQGWEGIVGVFGTVESSGSAQISEFFCQLFLGSYPSNRFDVIAIFKMC